jgi:hypothetical protein
MDFKTVHFLPLDRAFFYSFDLPDTIKRMNNPVPHVKRDLSRHVNLLKFGSL